MLCVAPLTGAAASRGTAGEVRSTAAAIRAEATRRADSPEGRPLPLACHWNTGVFPASRGWAPDQQLLLIEQGHFLLPGFAHPVRDGRDDEAFRRYYEAAMRRARELGVPLCFKATQWESLLSAEPYRSLPPEENPNTVTVEGKARREVCPFGPIEPWKEAGRSWTASALMKQLQEWYPDPPLVVFLSNNEHARLRWHKAEESKRYVDKFGKGKDAEFKRKVVADGWIERYRALQEGMRDGLTSPAWKKNAIFVGYGAFGPDCFGRWGGWPNYSLHSAGRISPAPLMWDGGSPSYYTHDWNPSRDCTVWSPQIEFMNLVFMQKEAHKLNPNFWLEFSVWDGYSGPAGEKKHPSPRTLYRLKGQTYDPTRYAGFIQFGMWLVRPRAVREFRGWTFPSEEGLPYFMALVECCDRVHGSPTLREFWRKGELVPNRAHPHPYQAGIPEEWKGADRWFLLDASPNPTEYPWELHWSVPVFSLALVRGQAPERQWLLYAHAPTGERKGVRITIPDYREITVDVAVGGSFYLVDEKGGTARPIGKEAQ